MTNDWVLGIDGKFRRYEILIVGTWHRITEYVMLSTLKSMRGYRVIEYSPYGETITKTFIGE